MGFSGVVFQFARVGNDEAAEEFLRELDDTSTCRGNVDTLSGKNLVDHFPPRLGDLTLHQQREVCIARWNLFTE